MAGVTDVLLVKGTPGEMANIRRLLDKVEFFSLVKFGRMDL
jgi:hypothetical protein